MKHLNDMLKTLEYTDVLTYKDELLYLNNSEKTLYTTSLFFVDAGYSVNNIYMFALSAPLYDIKGIVLLNENEYKKLMRSSLTSKFEITIENKPNEVVIRRQYGMRKILKEEFDSQRYILRKGFPDFPACPYGHTFKMLGYDMQTKTYVRLAPAILKEHSLQTIEYKIEHKE